jgi:hypothetical protein
MTTIAEADGVHGTHIFTIHNSVTGRYLIWFTKLPSMTRAPNMYEAEIFGITVQGQVIPPSQATRGAS